MELFNELTHRGSVVKSTESDNHITFKMRLGRKLFYLSYFFTDDGWRYEIANKFRRVVETGSYSHA